MLASVRTINFSELPSVVDDSVGVYVCARMPQYSLPDNLREFYLDTRIGKREMSAFHMHSGRFHLLSEEFNRCFEQVFVFIFARNEKPSISDLYGLTDAVYLTSGDESLVNFRVGSELAENLSQILMFGDGQDYIRCWELKGGT